MQKSPEMIVEELFADFYNLKIPTVDGHKTGLILSHHAALLASIAKLQDETSRRNMEMQEGILLLTKWLFGVTIILLIVALVQVYIAL